MAENTCPNGSKPDMFYVPQKVFESLKKKIAKGSKITDKEVDSLVNWTVKGSEVVIPVDMNGASENLDDFEEVLKKLGAAKTFACFCEAHKHFETTSKFTFPADEQPQPMTAKQWRTDNGEDEGEDEEDEEVKYVPDLFHVPKTSLEAIKKKLEAKASIAKGELDALVNWTAPDTEILVPVDMNGAEEDLDDFDEMLEKLDPAVIAKCFVDAEKRFEKMKSKMADDKLKVMTIQQYKATHSGDQDEEDEDDEKEANSEDDDESDEGDEDEQDDDEPASKKARHV